MPDVFISYSRRDKEFVRNLFERLEQQGHNAWVDWDDIEYAEDWWRKICDGIESADTFVFVMTPDSIRSKVCFDEVEFAVNCNKRIIPVLRREIEDEADQQRMHPALRRHNWLPLKEDILTDENLRIVFETIARDPEQVQAHTRLLMRARDWERAAHQPSLLLRGDDLNHAESWLALGVNREPLPTQLHAEYINASRIAERNRQRILFASVSLALLVSIGLGLLSFALFQQAEERRIESEMRGTAVAQQAATATVALGAAETNLRQAWNLQSRLLADFSRQELEAGNTQTALLLALESLQHAEEGIVNLENTTALGNALASPAEVLSMQHEDAVLGADWNADFSEILTYSFDGSARMWSVGSGETMFTLEHEDAILAAAWNADQSEILTASLDGSARVWDAASGVELLALRHPGAVWGAVWFDSDQRIMTISNEITGATDRQRSEDFVGHVRIWMRDGGREVLSLEHPRLIRFAWVNRDGTRIITSCDDGVVRVWDAASGELVLTMPHDFAVFRTITNADESRILSLSMGLSDTFEAGNQSAVMVWDARTGEQLLSLPYPGIASYFPVWNQDGSRIVTMSSDPESQSGLVQVWDAQTGAELFSLRHLADGDDPRAPEPQAVWNTDETRILSWAGKGIRVWDAASGDLLRTMQHEADVLGAVWSEDELQILAWDSEGLIQVWDVGSQSVRVVLRHEQSVQGARWDADEAAILSWSSDGTARLWNASDPAILLEISYGSPFGAAAWDPDGRYVASWSGTDAAVWDLETGARLITADHDGETVHGMAWNKAGDLLLSWGRDGSARILDAKDGGEILSLQHPDVVLQAQWSPDETRLFTRTLDGMMRVWDLATGTELFPAVQVVAGGSGGGAWSPDNRHILTWSSDERMLRLWDAESGEQTQVIASEQGFIGAVWNTQGTQFLYWNSDDTAHIWDVAAGAEMLMLTHGNRRADLGNLANDIVGAAWSKDGSRAISWTIYGDVRIWDAYDGTELIAVDDCGNHVRWSSDESRLLCARDLSASNGVRIWDIDRAELLLEYPLELVGQFDGVAWNADESRILAWTVLDSVTYVWISDVQELIEIGESRKLRELSAAERERFFIAPPP